jgi:putative (di)nucleoside polyphosphate hydrolase
MIDAQGFRPNVGIVIANDDGRLLWARRVGGRDAWQFPQGGHQEGEKPEDALYRELEEEVGLTAPDAVELVASTRGWLRYRLPKRYLRKGQQPLCIGQKQKWFLLRMLAPDDAVSLSHNEKPEFDHWQLGVLLVSPEPGGVLQARGVPPGTQGTGGALAISRPDHATPMPPGMSG